MSARLRIAIVGGGVAGMTAAWLLQHDHQVTLFDRAGQLGGHVETVSVEHGGETIHAELGPRFFFDPAYPFFLALLRVLGIRLTWIEGWASFTDLRRARTIVLPPRSWRQRGRLLASPGLVRHVLSLRRLVAEQHAVSCARDWSMSIRQYLGARAYPSGFGPGFAYPFLAACWGAPLAELPDFPAYSLLKGMPPGDAPGFYAIEGGMARYMSAFRDGLSHVTLRLGRAVRAVHCGRRFVLEDEQGVSHPFDRVVVATSARDASLLLREAPAMSAMRALVGEFGQFRTEIVIHGDAALMPADRRDWAHNNIFVDGYLAWMTDWQGLFADAPVFRTWLPEGRTLPQPLHARRVVHHLIMKTASAEVQQRIAAIQGDSGLWVSGMYAADVDNHESALLSGIVPALALAPTSPNLSRLLAALSPRAMHGLDILPRALR